MLFTYLSHNMLRLDLLQPLVRHVQYINQILTQSSVFVVGGAIRDILLGLETDPQDIDITLAGHPDDLYAKVQNQKDISHFRTEKYGTMTLIRKEEDTQYQREITPLRTEGGYADHRHPDEIHWSDSIVQDARRRDFTINCIYYTAYTAGNMLTTALSSLAIQKLARDDVPKLLDEKGVLYIAKHNILIVQKESAIEQFFPQGKIDEDAVIAYSDFLHYAYELDIPSPTAHVTANNLQIVIDPFGGIQDMIRKKLRAVGNADDRFFEDALRILRAVRIVNVLNHKLLQTVAQESTDDLVKISTFDFDTTSWLSLKKNYYLIKDIAKERIKEELCKVFRRGNPFGFVALLDEINILKWIFPSLYACKGLDQPVRYHPFDVYTHTLLTLKYLQEINNDYLTRFAMLYHDVGKVDQYYSHSLPMDREEIRKTYGSWINHHISGVEHVTHDFTRLGFSNKEIETIAWYVANHSKPGEILTAKRDKWEKKLRVLLSEAGLERVKNVLDITIGDRYGQMNPLQNSSDVSDVYELHAVLDELHSKE